MLIYISNFYFFLKNDSTLKKSSKNVEFSLITFHKYMRYIFLIFVIICIKSLGFFAFLVRFPLCLINAEYRCFVYMYIDLPLSVPFRQYNYLFSFKSYLLFKDNKILTQFFNTSEYDEVNII